MEESAKFFIFLMLTLIGALALMAVMWETKGVVLVSTASLLSRMLMMVM